MTRKTIILENMFRMVATPSQTEKLAGIYGSGNKGSANHYMLTIVYKKFVKMAKGDLEVAEIKKQISSEPSGIRVNSREGSYLI